MPFKYVRSEKPKSKKKRHFADYIVFLSIFAVTAFTVAAFLLQFSGMLEISATLTTCWFAFWTVEVVALATIRNNKVKKDYYKNKEDNSGGTG